MPRSLHSTIKEATVKRYYYDDHRQLETHLDDFIAAYNYARRPKTLRGLTPYEIICEAWAEQPQRFTSNPLNYAAGPNAYALARLPVRDPAGLGWEEHLGRPRVSAPASRCAWRTGVRRLIDEMGAER